MRFRKLRIAFSVTCGIACVLLIVLWVRRYWYWDVLDCGGNTGLLSNAGYIESVGLDEAKPPSQRPWVVTRPPWRREKYSFLAFGHTPPPSGASLVIAYWIPALLFATLAAASWLPWWSNRFSLRTLLIATTLVAVVLGLAVYAVRK